MPLNPITFNSFKGLVTNVNYLDNTKISGNILYDCNNIQFLNDGVITSRHGHRAWIATVTTDAAIKNAWYSLEFPYYNLVDLSAYIITSSTNNGMSTVYSLTPATPSTKAECSKMFDPTSISASNIVAAISPTTFNAPFFLSTYNNYIRWGNSSNRWYFVASNGLFAENFVDQFDATGKIFSRYNLPIIRSLTKIVPSVNTTGNVGWFVPGQAVKIIVTVAEYNSDSTSDGALESQPSFPLVINNIDYTTVPAVAVNIQADNKRNLNNLFVRVYRTQVYNMHDISPTSYYLAREIPFTKGVTSVVSGHLRVAFSSITLDLVDEALGFARLYTDPDQQQANAVHVPPPAARDFLIYKNYGIYAGITRPPYVETEMIALPATAGTDTFTVQGSAVTLSTVSMNSVIPPDYSVNHKDGYLTEQDMTFVGTATASSPLVIRAYDPSSLPGAGQNSYSVTAYAKGTGAIKLVGTGSTKTIQITADTKLFDTTRFQSPGILALVDYNTLKGRILDIVTYQDFEKIPNSNVIEFYECVSATNFSIAAAVSPYAIAFASSYFVFYLPGESVENLPVFPVGDTVGTDTYYKNGFSLVATNEKNPDSSTKTIRPFITDYVGIVNKLDDADLNGSGLKSYVTYRGILHKSPTRLIEDNIKILAANQASDDYIMFPGSSSLGITFMGKYVGTDIVGTRDSLTLAKTGTVDFDLNLTNVAVNYSEVVDFPNGIVISDQNQIESVKYRNIAAPLLVGNSKNKILRIAISLDQLYVFKENEGVYRIDLLSGGLETQAFAPILIDNTIWLTASESLQVLDGSIFFLSNRGVARLYNNNITLLSNNIETDLLNTVANEFSLNNVRSFGNNIRQLYGICFSTFCYVLQIRTGDWLKWDLHVKNAYTFPNGQLVTQSSDVYNHIKLDYFTDGMNTVDDQIDELIFLAGATTLTLAGSTLTLDKPADTTRFSTFNTLKNISNYLTKTIWYYDTSVSTYYKASFTSSATWGATNCKIQFASTIPAAFSANDSIYIGVNVTITPHRFFAGGPDTLTKFSKQVVQIQGGVTDLTTTFDVDSTAIAFTGQIITYSNITETAITDIPRDQARGRWITCQLAHSYPKEYLTLLGLTWVAKDMQTFRIKWKN